MTQLVECINGVCGKKGKLAGTLDLMVVLGFLAMVAYVLTQLRINPENLQTIPGEVWLLTGGLGTKCGTIIDYHRGTSQSSSDKNRVPS